MQIYNDLIMKQLLLRNWPKDPPVELMASVFENDRGMQFKKDAYSIPERVRLFVFFVERNSTYNYRDIYIYYQIDTEDFPKPVLQWIDTFVCYHVIINSFFVDKGYLIDEPLLNAVREDMEDTMTFIESLPVPCVEFCVLTEAIKRRKDSLRSVLNDLCIDDIYIKIMEQALKHSEGIEYNLFISGYTELRDAIESRQIEEFILRQLWAEVNKIAPH